MQRDGPMVMKSKRQMPLHKGRYIACQLITLGPPLTTRSPVRSLAPQHPSQAEFSALQGKAAVDAYPAYVQDLQDSRKTFRDNLGNDQARKMFDNQSLSTMGRTIFNGAGHAATENKKFALGSSHARVQALGDQALLQPKDDLAFQDSVNKVRDEVAQQGDLNGWGKDQVDQATDSRVSDLWVKRI